MENIDYRGEDGADQNAHQADPHSQTCALLLHIHQSAHVGDHQHQHQQQAVDNGDLAKSAGKAPEKGGGRRGVILLVHQNPQTCVQTGLGCADGKDGQGAEQKQHIQNDQIANGH